MTSRPVRFPWRTLAHLSRAETEGEAELTALARLEAAGAPLGLLAIPAAVEDGFYRSNDLPRRLAALYRGLDPADPDEDILEEAEPAAAALLGGCYLLDDVVDAFFDALAAAPGGAGAELVVRRAGAELVMRGLGAEPVMGEPGPAALSGGGRGALLAMKRLYLADWRAANVAARLSATGRLGLSARPVLVHGSPVGEAEAVSLLATAGAENLLAGAEAENLLAGAEAENLLPATEPESPLAAAGAGNLTALRVGMGGVVSVDAFGAVVALRR